MILLFGKFVLFIKYYRCVTLKVRNEYDLPKYIVSKS